MSDTSDTTPVLWQDWDGAGGATGGRPAPKMHGPYGPVGPDWRREDWSEDDERIFPDQAEAPKPTSSNAREMAQIRASMKRNLAAYFKDEAMQARYLELLQAEHGEVPDSEGEAVSAIITLPSIDDWTADGNSLEGYETFERIAGSFNEMLALVDQAELPSLTTGFEALPSEVHAVTFGMMAHGGAEVTLEALPSDEVAEIVHGDPAAAVMAEEWGDDAGRRFAIARDRLWQVLDRIPTNDAFLETLDWFHGLPVTARASILRLFGADRLGGIA
ncbi:MAG: hypothetical protein AAF683_04085 [Pseudomonadota bacterium]